MLLRRAGDFGVGHENGATYCGVADWGVLDHGWVAAAVLGVDYRCRENCGSNFQIWHQGAGDSGGDEQIGGVVGDYGFGGAAGRFGSDSSADHDGVVAFMECEEAGLVLGGGRGPGLYQGVELAVEGGDDGEFLLHHYSFVWKSGSCCAASQ